MIKKEIIFEWHAAVSYLFYMGTYCIQIKRPLTPKRPCGLVVGPWWRTSPTYPEKEALWVDVVW